MTIGNLGQIVRPVAPDKTPPAPRAVESHRSEPPAEEAIALSPAAKALSRASGNESLKQMTEVRSAIDSNRYEVDVRAIAANLIEQSASLLEHLGQSPRQFPETA